MQMTLTCILMFCYILKILNISFSKFWDLSDLYVFCVAQESPLQNFSSFERDHWKPLRRWEWHQWKRELSCWHTVFRLKLCFDGFPPNCNRIWVSAQNRPWWLLVQIQEKRDGSRNLWISFWHFHTFFQGTCGSWWKPIKCIQVGGSNKSTFSWFKHIVFDIDLIKGNCWSQAELFTALSHSSLDV